MTKKEQILRYLQKHRVIDQHIAIDALGVYGLGEYIRLLRKHYLIQTYYFKQPSVINRCVYVLREQHDI